MVDNIKDQVRINQQEAENKAQNLMDKVNAQHADIQQRMNEELRFLTVRDQQRIEQRELISKYYPEYGTQAGFGTGFVGGASAIAGGIAGLKLPGSRGMKLAMGTIGAGFGYVTGSSLAEQMAGTETSVSGREHLEQLKQFGQSAAYVARSDWQNSQGSILSPEAFKLDVAAPAGEIARAWKLNEKQFLPGAMDLLNSGLVESPGSSTGRSFKDVLKEAAGIFKSMQSFFGSVDIAGLSKQIQQMQMAGFTPEGMTELGRGMQNSFLAFAPDNIRSQVQASVIRQGAQMSAMGLSANVGGQAALAGYQSAYQSFGGLSGYEKSIFKTQGGLAEAISSNMTSVMQNPLLLAGRGDAMSGLRNITGNIDLTSPEGMRDYRKTIYGLSSTITQEDQIKSMDRSVESFMDMGLDRESAAEALFGSPEKARAYMIQREGFAKTMDRNIELLAGMTPETSRFVGEKELVGIASMASSTNSSNRLKGFTDMGNLGLQGTMLRHMARTRAFGSEGFSSDELSKSNMWGGYIQTRAWNRLGVSAEGVYEGAELAVGYKGDNDFQRLGITNPGEAARMAQEVSRTMEAYSEAAQGGDIDPEVEEALREVERSGGSEMLIGRLREEALTSGRGFGSTGEAAKLSREFGLNKVAKVLSDDRLRAQFLQKVEGQDKTLGVALTTTLYGARSMDPSKDMMGNLTSKLFKETRSKGALSSLAKTLKNPIVGASLFAGFTAGGAILGGVFGVGAGAIPGAIVGAKIGGWASAGATALGYGLDAIAGADEDNMTKAQAKRLNQSMYGTNAVVSMIVGSFPDSMTSTFKRLAEWNSTEKVPAARSAAKSIYGNAKDFYDNNPEVKEDEFVVTVVTKIMADLSNLVSNNEYLAQIYERYATNRTLLQRVVSVIFSYLQGHESAASSNTVVEAVGAEIRQITDNALKSTFGDADRKVAAARNLLGTTDATKVRGITARAGVEEVDVKQRENLMKSVMSVTEGTVRTTDGGETLKDPEQAANFYSALSKAAKEIQEDGITGVERQDAKVKQVLEEAGFQSSAGYQELSSIMQGIQKRNQTAKEMSGVVTDIIKQVLMDQGVKEALRTVFAPTVVTPTS